MSAGHSSLWKTLLLPPLFALLLYLLTIHILLPLYYRLRSRHSSSTSSSLRSRLPSWLTSIRLPRRNSASLGTESLLGDEELEEGFLEDFVGAGRGRGEDGGERRLSRELEVGFRDESDEEVEERRGRR